MRRFGLTAMMLALWLAFSGCEEKVSKPKTQDPLEALTYEYLTVIKAKDWDKAFGMLSADTQKYYDKKEFTEWATTFILPKVDAVYVTKITKHKLDAEIKTEFKPQSSWATYNTMEQAKVNLNVVFKDGKWWIHYADIVAKGMEKEQWEKERQERVAKWEPFLKFHDFRVENKITDNGPMLVVDGKLENTGDETVEMVQTMVKFFGPKGETVYSVVVVPIYVSKWDETKKALGPKETREFTESISSEIPDTWVGKFERVLYDAGNMPTPQ